MPRYLITKSLIESWSYFYSCHEKYESDAMNRFLKTLKREPVEESEAMANGREFEDEVYKQASGIARKPHRKWENGIRDVAAFIEGAQTQVKAYNELTVNGIDLLVYGVLDALKAGTIYDVKFSNTKFKDADLAGKYFDCSQHPAYFYIVPEAQKFIYLVSDGEDLYTETYTPHNSRPFAEIAKEFLDSLEAMNLLELYKEKWVCR